MITSSMYEQKALNLIEAGLTNHALVYAVLSLKKSIEESKENNEGSRWAMSYAQSSST